MQRIPHFFLQHSQQRRVLRFSRPIGLAFHTLSHDVSRIGRCPGLFGLEQRQRLQIQHARTVQRHIPAGPERGQSHLSLEPLQPKIRQPRGALCESTHPGQEDKKIMAISRCIS